MMAIHVYINIYDVNVIQICLFLKEKQYRISGQMLYFILVYGPCF